MEKTRKKMTIERLAQLTADEFARVDARFDLVDKRFDLVDARFNDVLAVVKTAKDDIVTAVRAIRDVKIENLEKDVAALKKKVGIA